VKCAIVHDFLMQMGGAEKVVEVLHEMLPDAPIYTSIYDHQAMPPAYKAWDIRPSFLQKLPLKQDSYRLFLFLYPLAFEAFDLSAYDLVISSSSAFAKGVITQPHTTHICYTHTPMRYAWMARSYVQHEKLSKFSRGLLAPGLHYLRSWDVLASHRVDQHIANSCAVAGRIKKFYRRDCKIIYPPVNTLRFQVAPEIEDYYVMVSRSVPYKRMDLAIRAFSQLKRPLKVIGAGRQRKVLQAIAGPTIEFLGYVSDNELQSLLAHAKAFIMPGEEDFGIAPVEANACGRPVIAYGAGGALDSQIHEKTGILFPEQTIEALCHAVTACDKIDFNPVEIQAHARQFDTTVFRQKMTSIINDIRQPAQPLSPTIPTSHESSASYQPHNQHHNKQLKPGHHPNSYENYHANHDHNHTGDTNSVPVIP